MRLGRLFRGIKIAADAMTAATGSLSMSGVPIPAQIVKLNRAAEELSFAGNMLAGENATLSGLDDFFDRAAMLDASIVLVMKAADGSELERTELSPFIVDAADAMLDRLEAFGR